ncbi:MAG: hypothetical protein IT158_11000 [Bryobacterales bacterium]|nr:hypothetical protein [Bryobacterales bacterium]
MNHASAATLCQAVAGPLILIALGGLFALDYFGGYSFWRTWPVLLILIGVLKLGCRGGDR